MAVYIVALDSGTHADATAAESAITGAGASITKTYKFNLTYKKINSCYIYMTSGGKSGKNLKSYIISSLEINNALKKNNFYSNIFLTLIRIPFKLLQIKFKWTNNIL